MSYAWIIDKDHLAVEELKRTGRCEDNAKGVTGPRDAPDQLIAFLRDRDWDERDSVEVFTFNMYDGDRILYYTGRMITDEGDTDEACAGPLDDFGRPNAGCVEIRYPGHHEMDIG